MTDLVHHLRSPLSFFFFARLHLGDDLEGAVGLHYITIYNQLI